MLSTHQLALEKLRYTDHELQPVPRHEHLCRFCIVKVESPEHALLECRASLEVLNLRNVFLGNFLRAVQEWRAKLLNLVGSIELLKALIYEHSTITLVGKFVHDVLEVFYRLPVYCPSRCGN
jgi:hypothetical protein